MVVPPLGLAFGSKLGQARPAIQGCYRSPSTARSSSRTQQSTSIFGDRTSSLLSQRSSVRQQRRHFSDKQTFRTQWGTIKLDLNAKHTVGVAQSRGERPYQEDAYSVHSILTPVTALKSNLFEVKDAAGWTPDTLEGFPGEEKEDRKRQVAYFGVFDGHGGPLVSKYLKTHLHSLIEESQEAEVLKVVKDYRAIGGYLRRYRGGPLSRFRHSPVEEPEHTRQGIGLDEMAVLGFLKADLGCLADESTGKSGSVGTVALLHSLDVPHSLPFPAASLLSLTIAHVGDTRAVLGSISGRPVALTENHHPDSRVESERLRQSGTGIVTDSFGESRWGGTLANTRGVGDREFKELGVIAEPVVGRRVLKGPEWAFLALVSDGITDSMSDQEIVDLCRGHSDPTRAASAIVSFAEDVGGEDNMTVIIVPLPGWGKMSGVDSSASRREYRLRQNAGISSGRQKRM
ncbi:protein serine/threonine phosphatase 2C [Meredithblackwellia eburnea MCA 4105]